MRLVWWAVGLLVTAWVLTRFSTLVIVAVIVAIITFPIYPAVDWLERRVRIARSAAAALVIFGSVAAIMITLMVVIPWIIGQFEILLGLLPGGVEAVRDLLTTVDARIGAPDMPAWLRNAIDQAGQSALTAANAAASRLVDLVVGWLGQIYLLLLIPLIVYFVMMDYPQLRASALALVAQPTRGRLEGLLANLNTTLRWGIWAQVVVSSIVGTLIAIGMWIVGVHSPVAIGLFAAVAEAIPYIGGFATYIIVVIIAAPQGGSIWAWGFLVVTIVKLLSNVLVPMVLGRMTKIHPLAIIVSLLALNQLFGVLGMFFAIPVVVVVREILAWWLPAPGAAPPAAASVGFRQGASKPAESE
ncbi:MAG TPA: AI-2E family transporter [bacterium]|jgi:predicted PurR-regulated permease PerM|nr:AI-2E family transporter [bacterium]